MSDSHPEQVSWQSVVLELLRRVAGAAPTMTTPQLRHAGRAHEAVLARKDVDGLYFSTCDPDHPLQRLYDVLWRTQLSEARAVLAALEDRGVDVMVFKGVEAGARYRPAHGFYVCTDVDLLVPRAALRIADELLVARGYAQQTYPSAAQGWTDVDPVEAFRFAAAGYELMPFVRRVAVEGVDPACLAVAARVPKMFRVRRDVLDVTVSFDVHHNVLFNFEVAPLRARAVAGALGAGRAFSPADHLWFLIHRYYFEVATGSLSAPRVLAPIAALANDPAVDWAVVTRNAVEQNATAPLLYWLGFLRQLGARRIPDAVLDELRACHADSERNFGWQVGRLFDRVEAFPANVLEG